MKISIIGAAGTVGSCAAFNIAIHSIADELVMIDDFSPDKLEGYVTDLSTAVTGLDTEVRAGSYADLRDSNIVLMAAGSSQVMANRMEVLPQNVPIIQDVAKKIRQYCPEAAVIIATNPVDPLNYAMFLSSGLERRQFIGYSANDSVRFRMFLAEALAIKSSRVRAMVIGEHGASQVLLFSSVYIDGKLFKISEATKGQIRQKVSDLPGIMEPQRMKTGRTQGWATSMGLAAICRAIAHDTRQIIPSSLVLEGEYGCRNMSMSVPASIGKEGVHKIEELNLDPDEREGLERSIETLKPSMRYVEEYLRKN
jgi:malate/lactate dehydrogenase